MSEKLFIFVVDTDKYAGNFEREMVAFMTGRIGECGVGAEYAEMYNEFFNIGERDYDHNDYICNMDEDGDNCQRPAKIWETPGWFNDGMGKTYRATDENRKAAVPIYIKERQKEIDNCNVHPNDMERTKARLRADIERVKLNGVSEYPAYLSVAIYMDRTPTYEETQRLVDRAIEFIKIKRKSKKWDRAKINVTGFRLIKRMTVEKTVWTKEETSP